MSTKDELGNRMKHYYEDPYRFYLTRRTPVIIRVDGKAFHSLNLKVPFDPDFMKSMIYAANRVADEMQGFKMGYVASDEASFLLTDFDKLDTDAWFGYNLNKLISISASCMSVYFNDYFFSLRPFKQNALFDSRAFNVPSEDVANYFLWRCKDWERNSVMMYCQSMYSHKELLNKSRGEQHELLYNKGKNWATDLSPCEKNGTFIFKGRIVDDFTASFEMVEMVNSLFNQLGE